MLVTPAAAGRPSLLTERLTPGATPRALLGLSPVAATGFSSLTGRASSSPIRATLTASIGNAALGSRVLAPLLYTDQDRKCRAAMDALIVLYNLPNTSEEAIDEAEGLCQQLQLLYSDSTPDWLYQKLLEVNRAWNNYQNRRDNPIPPTPTPALKDDQGCFEAFMEIAIPIAKTPIIGVIPSAGFLLLSLAMLVKDAIMAAFRSLELLWTSDENEVRTLRDHNVEELQKMSVISLICALQVISLGFFLSVLEN